MDGLSWKRLKPLLDEAAVVVFARDVAGRYIYVNAAFERLVGRRAAEVLGRPVEEVLPPEAAAAVRESDRQTLAAGRSAVFEAQGLYGSGRRTLTNFKLPLLDAAGRPWAVIGFGTDVTERRHREDALQAAALAVSSARGDAVFQELTRYLATILGVQVALVGRLTGQAPRTVRTLGVYGGGAYRENFEYLLERTPCREVVDGGFAVVTHGVAERFPEDQYLPQGAEGYAGYPLTDAAGRPIGVLAVISRQPIADPALFESALKIFAVRAAAELERKLHEEALAASEASYRAIFEAAEDAVFVHDPESGAILDVNAKACRTFGYSREEFRRLGVGELSGNEPPYTQAEARRLIGEVRDGRGPLTFEWRRRNKDGTLHWDEVTLKKVDIAGRPRILALTREITERKHAVEALRASEEQYRAIFDASADALVLWNADLARVDVNPTFSRIFGWSREEALADADAGHMPEEYVARRRELIRRTLGGERCHAELESRRKDGRRVRVEIRTIPFQHRGRPHALAIATDVTERKQAEERLRASEERYRLLFEMESDAIVLVDVDSLQHLDVNRAAVELYGYRREELLALKSTDLSAEPPQTRAAMQSGAREAKGFVRVPLRWHRKKDGTLFPVEITANFFELHGRRLMLAAIRDITERKQAEEARGQLEAQLRQAQKMEAIGQLTGGIAHDFNNILQSVLGNLTLAAEHVEELGDARLARYLERAQLSAQRARELIQQMLTFSRGRRGEPRVVALAPLVAEAEKLLRPTLPASLELALSLDSAAPPAMLDPVQVEQVLLNLCINARDAMRGEGSLAVAVRAAQADAEVCTACRQRFSGRFVELAVRDSGPGIAPEVVDRMFEPFFSTKEVGKGSGMGLSTVHGIVHEHGGHVLVDTAPGAGAAFRVLFPAAAGEARPEPRKPAARARPRLAGRLLVVEDEEMVREYLGDLLAGWGLEVTLKANGLDGKHAFAAEPESYDLVLTDHAMPRVTGLELARQIRAIRPGTPVILYTGFGEDIAEAELAACGVRAFARKPVEPAELLALLRTHLQQTRNTVK